MTDAKNPFEAMMTMGQDWVKQLNPAMESFTPKGFEALWPTMPKEMMETFFGKGLNPDGLDAKTRLLMTLMGLTIMGAQAEAQLRLTVRHLVEAGATQKEVAETIAMAAMFGGVPSMQKAMEIANDVMKKDDEA
ncbi:carboxymuconolactone decarboxylase family protein [Loktanella sp. M215]|uniref:carboxymuconolactone decarboxylase family protein n=1 Tax=Loktanella sp. M215 TaxID=2675431 RepID=UPI001F37708F|nr:carboxymuconolactone decarboxylase family protein [Loktanella sp. M215]MBU2358372.1 carboxymuconolactone decarboxylase family protein [Alphaproteobacteria bacterium]MCF7700393.1 carboxymuconolactone decarboxylase family protein [Loktanella sp. M215]